MVGTWSLIILFPQVNFTPNYTVSVRKPYYNCSMMLASPKFSTSSSSSHPLPPVTLQDSENDNPESSSSDEDSNELRLRPFIVSAEVTDPQQRAKIQAYGDTIPQQHQTLPDLGHEFFEPEECFLWLHNFSFCQGFAVVKGSGSDATGRKRYLCIHHGTKTKNTRKLEEHVVKDNDVTDARVGTLLDDNRNLVTGTTQEVLAIRDQLNHEDQARVDGHLQRANQAALQLAQAALERQQAGQFDLPDSIRQPEWLKKKKVHGKANQRSMTTAEMAEQAANQRERAKKTASSAPPPAPAAVSVPRLAPTAVPPPAPTASPPPAPTASPPLAPTARNPSPTPPPPSTAPGQLEGRTRRRQRGNGDSIDYAVLASLKRR